MSLWSTMMRGMSKKKTATPTHQSEYEQEITELAELLGPRLQSGRVSADNIKGASVDVSKLGDLDSPVDFN